RCSSACTCLWVTPALVFNHRETILVVHPMPTTTTMNSQNPMLASFSYIPGPLLPLPILLPHPLYRDRIKALGYSPCLVPGLNIASSWLSAFCTSPGDGAIDHDDGSADLLGRAKSVCERAHNPSACWRNV